MEQLMRDHERLQNKANLSKGVDDCQAIVDQLKSARQTIEVDPSSAKESLRQLEPDVKKSFDKVNDDLKEIYNALGKYSKSVEKKFKEKPLPFPENESFTAQDHLIDRAIAMHLLREGHFDVASSFISEADSKETPSDGDSPMSHRSTSFLDTLSPNSRSDHHDADRKSWEADFTPSPMNSAELQHQFEEMYMILSELKQNHNLEPAIAWAHDHSAVLDARGSNLEFDLCRLKYIGLFTSPTPHHGPQIAIAYARSVFPTFPPRYAGQIRQLLGALAYTPSLTKSPYVSLFDASSSENTTSAAATAFTSEFCALLSLSSASPLLTAVTAGCIALPTLLKFSQIQALKRTTWTTATELPVEIPLPPSFRFHSIFVCPVSKEQSTDLNPPMMMPCAHVVAQESLEKLSKGGRFKCPYCPHESHPKDAREVFL